MKKQPDLVDIVLAELVRLGKVVKVREKDGYYVYKLAEAS